LKKTKKAMFRFLFSGALFAGLGLALPASVKAVPPKPEWIVQRMIEDGGAVVGTDVFDARKSVGRLRRILEVIKKRGCHTPEDLTYRNIVEQSLRKSEKKLFEEEGIVPAAIRQRMIEDGGQEVFDVGSSVERLRRILEVIKKRGCHTPEDLDYREMVEKVLANEAQRKALIAETDERCRCQATDARAQEQRKAQEEKNLQEVRLRAKRMRDAEEEFSKANNQVASLRSYVRNYEREIAAQKNGQKGPASSARLRAADENLILQRERLCAAQARLAAARACLTALRAIATTAECPAAEADLAALATAEAELHAAKERLGVLERDMWAQARQATS